MNSELLLGCRRPYQGCQRRSGWRHPGWSHWGWTCPSACRRSPCSAPARHVDSSVTTRSNDTFKSLARERWESRVVFFVHIWRTGHLGHVVVVQGEVGELLVHGELHLVVVVTVLCHGCDSYSVWGHKKSGGVDENQLQKKKKIQPLSYVSSVGLNVMLQYLLSTGFTFRDFTKFFKRFVYESPCGQETPSHSVCQPVCQLCSQQACLSDSLTTCQTPTPSATARRLLIEQPTLCRPPSSEGQLLFPAHASEWFLFLPPSPSLSVRLGEVCLAENIWLQMERKWTSNFSC